MTKKKKPVMAYVMLGIVVGCGLLAFLFTKSHGVADYRGRLFSGR